jgi:hypothetical protein
LSAQRTEGSILTNPDTMVRDQLVKNEGCWAWPTKGKTCDGSKSDAPRGRNLTASGHPREPPESTEPAWLARGERNQLGYLNSSLRLLWHSTCGVAQQWSQPPTKGGSQAQRYLKRDNTGEPSQLATHLLCTFFEIAKRSRSKSQPQMHLGCDTDRPELLKAT